MVLTRCFSVILYIHNEREQNDYQRLRNQSTSRTLRSTLQHNSKRTNGSNHNGRHLVRQVPRRIERGELMETEHEPQPATQYEDSYASTPYRDDHALAVGCGVVAVIVLFLTVIALVVTL